jgi:hypothetical protein
MDFSGFSPADLVTGCSQLSGYVSGLVAAAVDNSVNLDPLDCLTLIQAHPQSFIFYYMGTVA